MKINYLKINGFGKIKNKEINFKKNINLIYGKNESGKSTLLKFIKCMLYGISKNKNGKAISDFEKYKPWNGDDFSGKLKYILDNKNEYEVYREFSKKNPKIYNNNLEDISKEFNIDKTKGNQFFYEQTKIDESLFLSTNIVEQQEVVLDNNSQGILTQKIANILSSGEDNISYKKVMDNLNKKLIQDVGTERTVGRPLNEVTEKINLLKKEKENLQNISYLNNDIKENKKELNENIITIEKELELLKEIKLKKEDEEKENEKVNINQKIIDEYDEKIINLKNELNKKEIKKETNKNNLFNLIIITILIILNILINFIKLPNIINKTIIVGTSLYLVIYFIVYLKNKIKINKKNNEENTKKIKLEKEIEILEENKSNKEQEINNIINEVEEKNNSNLNLLKNKFKDNFTAEEIIKVFNCDLDNLNNEFELLNRELNNKNLELNTLNIKEKDINNVMEQKLKCEEQLENLEEEKQELLNLEESINIAKEALEKAYNEMKNDVTPKFTKDLSLLIEKISNNKYNKANFDAEYGLRVENENGEYIDCNKLSIGTIDQLYLSLRLSAMNEISEEKMPIILDEAFAYYDNERLENILKFINENYKENQVLIFTCSNREKEILDKLNVEYNLIEL